MIELAIEDGRKSYVDHEIAVAQLKGRIEFARNIANTGKTGARLMDDCGSVLSFLVDDECADFYDTWCTVQSMYIELDIAVTRLSGMNMNTIRCDDYTAIQLMGMVVAGVFGLEDLRDALAVIDEVRQWVIENEREV